MERRRNRRDSETFSRFAPTSLLSPSPTRTSSRATALPTQLTPLHSYKPKSSTLPATRAPTTSHSLTEKWAS